MNRSPQRHEEHQGSQRNKLKLFFVKLCVLCVFVVRCSAFAEDAPFETGLELIRNELLCAKTGLRALAVAAHPDDEDGGTLSYLRRTLGVETHICFMTRGEGGQNEAGPELGADLAVVRTHEIEAACKILGAKAWYANLPDFGYSKSADETLNIWGHDEALKRLVRIIRLVRPDIVFTNHDPHGTDHGHHVATARLVVEAFDAAADPNKCPEQMKEDGTQAWAVKKLYLRRFNAAPPLSPNPSPQRGEGNGAAVLTIDLSQREGVTGLNASEIGALALEQHKSQGMLRTLKVSEREMRYFSLAKTLFINAGGEE